MPARPLRTTLNAPDPKGRTIMNGFQHLPEYASAAQSYRVERTLVERASRRTHERPSALRRLIGALSARAARPARRLPAAR
jgi:hypothetical protein